MPIYTNLTHLFYVAVVLFPSTLVSTHSLTGHGILVNSVGGDRLCSTYTVAYINVMK